MHHQKGAIAQLVEQRTENPCVLGSIPSGTTHKARKYPGAQRVNKSQLQHIVQKLYN